MEPGCENVGDAVTDVVGCGHRLWNGLMMVYDVRYEADEGRGESTGVRDQVAAALGRMDMPDVHMGSTGQTGSGQLLQADPERGGYRSGAQMVHGEQLRWGKRRRAPGRCCWHNPDLG